MSMLVRGSTVMLLALGASVGCSHLIESRAIDRFATNLHAENLDGLKSSVSSNFNENALRTATALDDIKILRIPDGKVSIVEVEEVDETKRRVTVEVGDNKREVFYELVKDDTGKWVVDDVYLKQKNSGVVAYKSVTEQMDLLLTVREFYDAWDGGDREAVLNIAAPPLRAALEPLPPTYLAKLTRDVLGERASKGGFRPQAQLDESTAVVKLPRVGGSTVISLALKQDKWQVTDIAVDSKNEEKTIPSVQKLALAVNTCVQFLAAYERNDKNELKPLSDRDFFEGALEVGNLKQVVLPSPQLPEHDLTVQLRAQRADFMLKGNNEIIHLDMRREDAAEPEAPPKFYVTDVTIFEIESQQEKRLSALFTAQGMLELFCQALAERDLDHLRHCSSLDFRSRVWQSLNNATIQGLPLETFDDARLAVEKITFQGSLTRVEARQSGQAVTYLLREESGRFFVDDIVWQISGRPNSVKETLALMIPIKNFAASISLARDPKQQALVLEMLQETSSSDLNRLVWQQTKFVPNSGLSADSFLAAPLKSIVESETEALVQLGDEQFGAMVRLRKEHGRTLVDDVTLIAGSQQADRVAFKHTLRTVLASGTAVPPSETGGSYVVRAAKSKIQQAVYEEPADAPAREILSTSDKIDIGPYETDADPLQ